MRIVVGCDIGEFKRYYTQLARDKEWQGAFGFTEELDASWERVLVENPPLLFVFRENVKIIGHAIWHETGIDEHRKGGSRDRDDREILEKLCGGKGDRIVELHELWLRKRYRGKGYGKRFFEFFEDFIMEKKYDCIVYYADHPAAIAICRKRGWREGFLAEKNWHVFCCFLIAIQLFFSFSFSFSLFFFSSSLIAVTIAVITAAIAIFSLSPILLDNKYLSKYKRIVSCHWKKLS